MLICFVWQAVESDHAKFCRLLKAPPERMTPDLASALDLWDIQERAMAQGYESFPRIVFVRRADIHALSRLQVWERLISTGARTI